MWPPVTGPWEAVTETLPAEFSYVSSSLTGEGRGHSRSTASTIKFILQGADKTFTYTVTASEHGGHL